MSNKIHQRQLLIMNYLKQNGETPIVELVSYLRVSINTVRGDLSRLIGKGKVTRLTKGKVAVKL